MPKINKASLSPARLTCAACPRREDCTFDQKRLGGFKGTRPHYIGVRTITDSIENHGAKEDIYECLTYVEALKDRAVFGRQQVDQGRDGDRIKVIAQEGDTITWTPEVGFNIKGEIVKPQREHIEAMKAAGYEVSYDGRSEAVEWRKIEIEMVVPNWEEVQARKGASKNKILLRELADERAAIDEDEDAYAAAVARRRKDVKAPKPKPEPVAP